MGNFKSNSWIVWLVTGITCLILEHNWVGAFCILMALGQIDAHDEADN
jgi:hypothetical protein